MERRLFEQKIAELSFNYRQKVDMKTVDLYWEHFKATSFEDFSEAVKSVIEKEEFFPTIAVIKKHVPRSYPEHKEGWPVVKDFEKARQSSIAKDCSALITKKITTKMTMEEYYQAILELDKKYPGISPMSFWRAAEMYIQGKRDV